MDAFKVVRDFEAAIAEYTGAKYVVCVNSCTAALRLALMWSRLHGGTCPVTVPKRTYPSVPMAVIRAGFSVRFDDFAWEGLYELIPTGVSDAAKRFTGGMYIPGTYQCVSFHPQKPLGLSTGGGAILHDWEPADSWFRRMRYDGRAEGVPTKDDTYTMIGEHCYMMPPAAAEGLHRLSIYAKQRHHEDQPSELDQYPDLSKWAIFNTQEER